MKKRDPFRPPGTLAETPVELARDPRASSGDALRAVEDEPLPLPARRARTRYRRPDGSQLPLVIWLLAAVGGAALFVVTVVGARHFYEGLHARAREAASPKPVNWQPLAKEDTVLLTVRTSPRDATLLVDGAPAESNPVRVKRAGAPVRLVVSATGFVADEQVVVPDRDRTVLVTLRRADATSDENARRR